MKSWLIKALASQGLKLGVAYALRAVVLATDAINGVIEAGNISEQINENLLKVARALVAVSKLIEKVSDFVGAPVLGGELRAASDQLEDATDKLNRITGGI